MTEKRRVGRKPKSNSVKYRYTVNMTEEENSRFQELLDRSEMKSVSKFISAMIFQQEMKVVKYDKSIHDYYMKLTNLFSQFRAIGVNYNQVTKAIKTIYSEKKSLTFLYRLEKETIELIKINKQIVELTEKLEGKWLQK